MGFFGRWFKPAEQKQTFFDRLLTGGLGTYKIDDAMLFETDTQALQVSTVLACVWALSSDAAVCPIQLRRWTDSENSELAKESPLYRLIHDAPNPESTAFDFVRTMGLHLGLSGNAYALINRIGGAPRELWPIQPENVFVERRIENGRPTRLKYTISDPTTGVNGIFGAEDILHLKNPSWDSIKGLNMTHLARKAISLAAAIELSQIMLYQNGANPSGVLTVPKTLTEAAARALAKSWENAFAGVGNAARTAVLDNSATWQKVSMSGVDAQTIETRNAQIEDICRFYNVHPQRIFAGIKGTTFASAEAFSQAHVSNTMHPIFVLWEQALNRALLPENSGLFFKFNIRALLQTDLKSQTDHLAKMIASGVYSPNDARRKLDMAPREGGDDYLVPLNMTNTLDQGPDNGRPAA